MIKTTLDVEIPMVSNSTYTPEDSFIWAYSEWMDREYVKYLYAHGKIEDTDIHSIKMTNRYIITWSLPPDSLVWFLLKWSNAPGVTLL